MNLPYSKTSKTQNGFTLIELLIVIAVIAIIAVAAFVALDPLTRFQDARDSVRWQDVTAILDAAKIDQVDNGGAYLTAITNAGAGTNYMIGTGTTGCNSATCDVTILADDTCVDLTGLVTEGYLSSVPTSPTGDTAWDSDTTGYYLTKSATGSLTIGACESENSTGINVAR